MDEKGKPDSEKAPPPPKDQPKPIDETQDDDFQLVLKELVAAYQPILEEDLARAKSPDKLLKEARQKPPDCDSELQLADRIFSKFYSESVALSLLPAEGRHTIGPIDKWRWCLLHIRCCTIFGWLVCRGPRTFRALVYYLYRYWLCVRQILGIAPIGRPLTAEERHDLETLVQALATAYKPYLTDQLATVDFTATLSDEVTGGQIDCFEGQEDAAQIFERLLTLDTAQALLGKEAFAAHSKEPFFWFCRCWCLCAIRFGCCLARARSLVDLVHCLVSYRRCLRECFRPIRCDLTKPTGCVEEEINPKVGGLAVEVVGTATGAFFDHYTIEWRKVEDDPDCSDDTHFKTEGVVYPGGAPTGSAQVVGGALGWINTTVLPAGAYEVRVCVFATTGARVCCCKVFNLFKRLVWIERVAISPGAPVQTPPGPFVSTAPIVNMNPGGVVVPVGGCVTVKGSAWVGECEDRKIKCFDLRYGMDFLPGPGEIGFNPASYFASMLSPGPVCYTPPDEAGKRAPWNQVISGALTTRLVLTTIDLGGGFTITVWKLQDYCFDSANQLPPCPDATHHCRSGKYTLLLQVEDTASNLYYDTQHVWFDNKPIHVEFGGLEGLPPCSDLCLGKFIPPGAPCMVPWPMNALGIAYDEYIINGDLAYPSDNFDYYLLQITRQGGPTYTVPITPVLGPPVFGPNPLLGSSRVGDPGKRCEEAILGCPPPPIPAKFYSVLTQLDLRIFDAVCAASLAPPFTPPAGFALNRDECCGYTFQLYAQDKTWSDGWAGGFHHAWSLPWAVCICNSLECPKKK